MYIYHGNYIKEFLKKFDMSECKMSKTLMYHTCILEKDKISAKVYHKVYKGMIDSLLHLTTSRSDILFSVCLCARFQSDIR